MGVDGKRVEEDMMCGVGMEMVLCNNPVDFQICIHIYISLLCKLTQCELARQNFKIRKMTPEQPRGA